MRSVILRGRHAKRNKKFNNHNEHSHKPTKSPSFNPKKFTKANSHELLAEIMSPSFFSEINEVDNAEDEKDSESTLLVKSNSDNSINP